MNHANSQQTDQTQFQEPKRPVIYGEVLFDCFPDGNQVLGGAPFNVAWHLCGFGENPLLISRIGQDSAGDQVRQAMTTWGMETIGLQTDPQRLTGAVQIKLVNGEPIFDIVPGRAYDAICLAELPDLDDHSIAFLYHGTLALRQAESRMTLETMTASLTAPVFLDVNLRSPWWALADVQQFAMRANWLKLNQDELNTLTHGCSDHQQINTAVLDQPDQILDRCARHLQSHYDLDLLLLTRGSAGAGVYRADEHVEVTPHLLEQVVDTVGAGDAFTAVFLLGTLHDWPLTTIMERAQLFASAIVGVQGATVMDRDFYKHFLDSWIHH
jgi:fructokinase